MAFTGPRNVPRSAAAIARATPPPDRRSLGVARERQFVAPAPATLSTATTGSIDVPGTATSSHFGWA